MEESKSKDLSATYNDDQKLAICNMHSKGYSLRLARAIVDLNAIKDWPAGDKKRAALKASQEEVAAAKVKDQERRDEHLKTTVAMKKAQLTKELAAIEEIETAVAAKPVAMPEPEPTPKAVAIEKADAELAKKQAAAEALAEGTEEAPAEPAPAPEPATQPEAPIEPAPEPEEPAAPVEPAAPEEPSA
jgi:hypothetical protein